MDEDVARRRKIEEGRRRLERIKAKKDGDKPDVHLAKKPLPSPFAVAVRKPLPEFKVPEGRSKAQRPVQGNKENEPGDQADAPERWPAIPQQDSDADKVGGPKTLDDAIDGLRELDRSYTPQVAAVCVCVPPYHHPHTHAHAHMHACTHARTRQVASRLLAAPQQAEGGAEAASRERVADDSAGVGPAAVAVVVATAEESEASASGAPCRGGYAREDAGDGGGNGGDAGGDAREAGGDAGEAGAGGLGAIAGGRASGYEQAGVGPRAVDRMDGGADVGPEVRMIAGSGAAEVVVSSRCETKRCRSVNVWVSRCLGVSVCRCVGVCTLMGMAG